MGKNNKKRKPNKQKIQKDNFTWDSLEEEKNKLLSLVSEQQIFIHNLVSTELTEEDLKKEPEFAKTFNGLNKTYLDLLTRTLEISKEHGTVIEEKVVEGLKLPIVECQKGKVDSESIEEVMKYQAIINKYAEVGFSLSSVSTGPMSELVFGVTEIVAKKEKVNPKDIEEISEMKAAVENFKEALSEFDMGNIHTLVPTQEDIKNECKEAVENTEKMIQEELEDINQSIKTDKKEENNGQQQ